MAGTRSGGRRGVATGGGKNRHGQGNGQASHAEAAIVYRDVRRLSSTLAATCKMAPMDLIALIAGAVVAAPVAYLVARGQALRHLGDARAAAAAELAAAQQDSKWLRDEVERHKQAAGSTQELLDKAQQALRDTFQSLAAQALKENRSTFLDLARTSFEGYQQPIAETLRKVDQRLTQAERERLGPIPPLRTGDRARVDDKHALAGARTPAVRGRWGEMQLRRVVEIAGMLQRCDFDEQAGVQTENGRLRPISSSTAGRQAASSWMRRRRSRRISMRRIRRTRRRRVGKLQAHARQVRDHMDRLAARRTGSSSATHLRWSSCSCPGETLFSAALQHDLGLIEYGLQHRCCWRVRSRSSRC